MSKAFPSIVSELATVNIVNWDGGGASRSDTNYINIAVRHQTPLEDVQTAILTGLRFEGIYSVHLHFWDCKVRMSITRLPGHPVLNDPDPEIRYYVPGLIHSNQTKLSNALATVKTLFEEK